MEPIGFVISVASLVGVFKDCIDLLSMISATKSLGTDFEILNAKLDVEKTLLLQWSQRARLLQPDYDERLNDWRTNKAVADTLCALRSLLSKTDDLQKKYGLRRNQELDSSAGSAISTIGKGIRSALMGTTTAIVGPGSITPIISGPRMKQFLSDFDAFNQRVRAAQKQSSIKKRLMWVVRDREDFSQWIQQISDFVSRLNTLIPPRQDSDTAVAQLVQDIENIKSTRGIQLVLHAAKQIDDTTADSADKYLERRHLEVVEECQYRILNCLRFSTINDRIRSVTAAHAKTLQWLLNTTAPSPEIKGDSIAEWLESGSGVYWVCGKAGSGKSTLMKHLFWELEETDRLLETWAGDKELITAAFFFWHLGTPEQKTKEGLFRSLLYTILDTDPSLIPYLLPGMWQDAYDLVTWRERKFEQNLLIEERRQQQDEYSSEDLDQGVPKTEEEDEDEYIRVQEINKMVEEARPHAATAQRTRRVGRRELRRNARPTLEVPSTGEMGEAFQRLKREQTKHKFCFFIDGLDEYLGDHLSGTDIILSLTSSDDREDSDKIKIIVSSRPIPVCVQAFSRKKQLQLQDITRGDIAAYVDDTIRSHEYIENIITIDEACVNVILYDLVEKASGVFLWVVLACRSLLEGFAAYDFPEELRRRVDELPPELELLFKHMLDKMEKRYQQLAAKLLRVCYQARVNEDERRHAWALDSTAPKWTKLSADDETVLGLSTLGLTLLDEYGFDLAKQPDGRALSSHEIYAKCQRFDARLRSRCCGLLETRRLERLAESTVEFMHRSVFEFLSSEGVLDLPCLQVDDSTSRFEPNAVLSRMYLHAMPLVTSPGKLKVSASGSLVSLRYSRTGTQARLSMLQQFARVTFGMIKKASGGELKLAFFKQVTEHFPKPTTQSETTLALLLAAELGMIEVVLRYAATAPEPSQTPLLYYAVGRPYTRCLPIWRLPVPPEMIKFLLSESTRTHSPNERFNNSGEHLTPWTSWLRHMQQSKGDTEPAAAFEEITRLFVKAGADVTARLPNGVLHTSLESLIRWRILEAGSEGNKSDFLESAHMHPLAERCDEVLRMVEWRRTITVEAKIRREAKRREMQNQPKASSWVEQCTMS